MMHQREFDGTPEQLAEINEFLATGELPALTWEPYLALCPQSEPEPASWWRRVFAR
jgi:hypothetical protein